MTIVVEGKCFYSFIVVETLLDVITRYKVGTCTTIRRAQELSKISEKEMLKSYPLNDSLHVHKNDNDFCPLIIQLTKVGI